MVHPDYAEHNKMLLPAAGKKNQSISWPDLPDSNMPSHTNWQNN